MKNSKEKYYIFSNYPYKHNEILCPKIIINHIKMFYQLKNIT